MASRNQRKKKRANKRGSGSPAATGSHSTTPRTDGGVEVGPARRRSSETKPSYKTTELVAYAATVLAVVLTALALDDDGRGGADPFGAEPAIRYVVYLTIGYLVARGLAKSGSWASRPVREDDQREAPVATVVEHRDVEHPDVDHRDVDHHDVDHHDVDERDDRTEVRQAHHDHADHDHADHDHADHDHADHDHADHDHADHDEVLTGARDSVERDRFGAPVTANRTDGS